jgi:predicted DNA-binding protein YlxM (UPF0122 family)
VKEIGQLFEIPQPNVSNIIHGLTQIKLSIMDAFSKEDKSIEEICDYYKIDQVLAWGLILDGKSDLERFELFGRNDSENKPNLYNAWRLLTK